MEFFLVIMAIPITAIVLGIGSEMWKTFLKHQERKLEIKAGNQNAADSSVLQQIEDLREEVARLRDTSTQYDISIQHTLEELQQRMTYVEGKVQSKPFSGASEQTEEPARLARS
jgi:TolA-binding protein